jgi:hypothetical protein
VTKYSDAKIASVNDLAQIQSTAAPQGFSALSAAVALGTVKSKSFLQQRNNITDSETQSGVIFYDGSRVWVTSTYRGFTGSQRCQVDWAVAYTVAPQNCSDSGSASQRVLSQQWLFTLQVGVVPVSWSETYTLQANASGQIW